MVINHLKTRGNSQRNRAVDEYEYYSEESKEALIKFLSGILRHISEMAFNEVHTAIKTRVEDSEEILKNLKSEMDKRLEDDIKMLEGEV